MGTGIDTGLPHQVPFPSSTKCAYHPISCFHNTSQGTPTPLLHFGHHANVRHPLIRKFHVPSQQKFRMLPNRNIPKSPQPICVVQTLQDGRHSPSARPHATRRLVPIHPDRQPYLCFHWNESLWQFTCLPFGLSSAPWCFTKLLKPVIAFFRSHRIRSIICCHGSLGDVLASSSGLYHQPSEICPDSI